MRLNPDTGLPESSPDTTQRGYGLHWRRRIGRAGLAKEDKPTLHRDEMLTREQCIVGLRRFWFALPHGARRPLARHIGMSYDSIRRMLKLQGGLPDACKRRLSRFLMEYQRGEIELHEISPNATPRSLWIAGKPSHAWIRNPRLSTRITDPQYIQALEREAEGVVFQAPNERLFG